MRKRTTNKGELSTVTILTQSQTTILWAGTPWFLFREQLGWVGLFDILGGTWPISPGGLQRGAQRMTRRTKSNKRGRRINMRKVDWLPVRPLWAPRRAKSKFQSHPAIQVTWQQVHLEFIWTGGGFLAPNVKGQHLLNLGPQLFKHTNSAQEENKTKGQLQSPGAIKSQTATQTPATKYKTPVLQTGEANTASQSALSLLQKDGPHHVLLAPSVYAEVKALAKSKLILESKFSGWFANSIE